VFSGSLFERVEVFGVEAGFRNRYIIQNNLFKRLNFIDPSAAATFVA